ncbi:MAG: tetratricopeptide repeat-containing glycosyltransferase family protein [Candidatus Gastranaerophilales bacterium]|nr:tetratricopeptide repeat-containing glycosyltransferase family protein [Candidatus Gastranaerophilales bacterium]
MQGSSIQLNLDGIKYLAITHHDLAMMHYSKDEKDKALFYFQEAIKYFDKIYIEISASYKVNETVLADLKTQINGVRNRIIEISCELAQSNQENEQYPKAIEHYSTAIYYSPDNAELYYNLGKCVYATGAYNSALLLLDRALQISQSVFDAYRVIGDIYVYNIQNPQKAIEYYEQYINFNGSNGLVYNMLGHLYEKIGKYQNIEKQVAMFEKCTELMPDFKCGIKNLALVYPRIGKNEQAIACYHKLFKLGPTMDDRFDYACLKIKMGDFEQGWKYYEYRFQKENGPTHYPQIKKPKWQGEKIPTKTLLVQYEQGFGDSIQFFRYLPQIKPLVSKIIFRVQNDLVDLFKINSSDIEIVGMDTPLEAIKFDYHTPLMSLPHILKIKKDDIPSTQGYIKADANKAQEYKKKVFNHDSLKIGISFQGSKDGNERRNIPLETFYPLTQLSGVKVYSFQKGFGSEQLQNLPADVQMIDLGTGFRDFSDTAAALSNLDLFVTSDNGVFNLAASMGVKTFLLLNQDSEWRWFFDEEKTPWYDSVKIFKKQNEEDDWSLLMQKVVDEIRQK